MGPLAIAGISAGTKLLSGLIGSHSDYNNQKNLMTLQHNWSIEDWNRQNEYNSPANQVKRLQEAGLNPNLVFGGNNPNVSSSSISQPAPTQSNRYQRMSEAVTESINMFLDLQAKQQEIKNLKAQQENIEADTKQKAQNAATQFADQQLKEYQLKFNNATYDNALELSNLAVTERKRSNDLLRARYGNVVADTFNKELSSRNIALQGDLIAAEIEKTYSDISINHAQLKLIASTIILNSQNAALAAARAEGVRNENSIFYLYKEAKEQAIEKLKIDIEKGNIDVLNLLDFGTTTPGNVLGSYSQNWKGGFNILGVGADVGGGSTSTKPIYNAKRFHNGHGPVN